MEQGDSNSSSSALRGHTENYTASKGQENSDNTLRGQSSTGTAQRGKKTSKSSASSGKKQDKANKKKADQTTGKTDNMEEEVLVLTPCNMDILTQSDNDSVKSKPVSESILDSDQDKDCKSTNSTQSTGPSSSRSSSNS